MNLHNLRYAEASSAFSPDAARLSLGIRKNAPDAQRDTILELEGIKVTSAINQQNLLLLLNNSGQGNPVRYWQVEANQEKKSFHRCISVTCKSWLCPDCRRIKGHALRDKLLEKAKIFKEPRLYTITVNRKLFRSPEEAYNYVMSKKFIARLLTKEMKIRRWFWVFEVQEESGDGWPHWHILLDVADLPGKWYNSSTKANSDVKPVNINAWCYIPHFFDLNKVHSLLRKWKIGEQCYLSVRKDKFKQARHAINYITKYLIKTPQKGYPSWVWKHSNLRFYQPSYDVGSMKTDEIFVVAKEEKKKRGERKSGRIPLDRVSECGLKVLYQFYDSASDRIKIIPPVWGTKSHLKESPVCDQISEFDFERKRAFSVYGFWHIEDLEQYHSKLEKDKDFISSLMQEIDARKQLHLHEWEVAS